MAFLGACLDGLGDVEGFVVGSAGAFCVALAVGVGLSSMGLARNSAGGLGVGDGLGEGTDGLGEGDTLTTIALFSASADTAGPASGAMGAANEANRPPPTAAMPKAAANSHVVVDDDFMSPP